MTTTDRICAFLESKLPHSFWRFHGDSIRAFVEKELVELALAPNIETCEQSMRDYAAGRYIDLETLISQGQALTSEDFHSRAKVSSQAMLEVIGGGDAGVSQSQPLDPLRCCDLCSRGLVDFAAEKREPIWRTIADAGCELTVCQDCWEIEQQKEASS